MTDAPLPTLPVRIREGLGMLATRAARRFAFDLDALRIKGWRGRSVHPWATVRSARLVPIGRRVALSLTLDDGRVIRIPLTSYHASVRLAADIERRLPVAISSSHSLQARLEAADRS